MRIVDGLFTLANVAIGGIIGALATGRATRLSARADAIDDFCLLRPLWSQNSRPAFADVEDLQNRHISLRGKLLIAGVPYPLLEWYEATTVTYLNLHVQPTDEWTAAATEQAMAATDDFGALADCAFYADRLINAYLQRPIEARLRYHGRTYRRHLKRVQDYVLANRPAM
jgi:hypothetical protein